MRFARFASVPSRSFLSHSSLKLVRRLARYLAAARYLAVGLLLLAAAIPGFSQSDRGAIAGTVLDSSGGAVTSTTRGTHKG